MFTEVHGHFSVVLQRGTYLSARPSWINGHCRPMKLRDEMSQLDGVYPLFATPEERPDLVFYLHWVIVLGAEPCY